MGLELDKIPGLPEVRAAAEAADAELRDLAFIAEPVELCGVLIRPLTLRSLLLLFTVRSPFFYAAPVELPHAAQFLWIQSIDFRPGDLAARDAFMARLALQVDLGAAIAAIDQFIDDTFMDRPPAGGPRRAAITSFVAAYIDAIASAYHWSKDQILDEPIAALFQLLRRIEQRTAQNPKFISRADKVVRAFVKQYLKEHPEQRPAPAAQKGKKRGL